MSSVNMQKFDLEAVHLNHKILPGNIFGLILKNQMAATGVFSLLASTFVGPLEQRVL